MAILGDKVSKSAALAGPSGLLTSPRMAPPEDKEGSEIPLAQHLLQAVLVLRTGEHAHCPAPKSG